MKKLFFAGFLIFLFASCSKDGINLDIGFGDFGGLGGFHINVDSTSFVKADITTGATTAHFSATGFNVSFSSYIPTMFADSSILTINAHDTSVRLEVVLINILSPGTYVFGQNAGGRNREVRATYSKSSFSYFNNPNIPSGSITIDTLTSQRIHGTFNVLCQDGTQSVNITNGSFGGRRY